MAGQTVWYGVSSIAARFINYLITPILTYSAIVSVADFGRMGAVYAIMPLMNVLFTYGMETTYFRFLQDKNIEKKVNTTASVSLLCTTILFSVLLWLNQSFLVNVTTLQGFPLLIQLSIIIITLDALTTIPFARLRNEGKPKLFALIRVAGIFIYVGLTAFFVIYCPV